MKNNRIFWFISCLIASTCGCDLGDVCGLDDDGDGFTNCEDVCPIHFDANFIDRKQFKEKGCANCQDSDEDGIIDCLDLCPEDKDREWGDCGCVDPIPGTEGIYMTCPDIDGLEDLCPNDPMKTDPGVCGCGVSDRLIVWDDDNLTQGNPRSECPRTDNVDLCPFDDDKTDPGQCGCGVPDTDSDNDSIPDCEDLCPEDPQKEAPGACGCGVEDSVANLRDTDNDGTVDCQDKCPENPYKITPEPTTCDDWDTDGDGVEDPQDVCPYNPNLSKPNADGSKPDCNYVTDSEGNSVFEIWDARDLTRLKEELETKVIPEGRPGMMCNPSMASKCVGEYDKPAISSPDTFRKFFFEGSNYVSCKLDPQLGIGILTQKSCEQGCGYWRRVNPPGGTNGISHCYDEETYEANRSDCMSRDLNTWHICIDKENVDYNAFDCEKRVVVSCNNGCESNSCKLCSTREYTSGGTVGACCNISKYALTCQGRATLLKCDDRGRIYAENCGYACINEDQGARCKFCENELTAGGKPGDCCHPTLYSETCTGKGTALICHNGIIEEIDCIGDCYPEYENKIFCIPKEDIQVFHIELKHDINLSTHIPANSNLIGCIGDWNSVDLYQTYFNGNNHTITFTTNYGNERCALSKPLFESAYKSVVSNLNVDVDFRGEFNGAVVGFSNHSAFKNVNWSGGVMIETSIYGNYSYGEVCMSKLHKVSINPGTYTAACRQIFGGFAGYAIGSIFDDIQLVGRIVAILNDYDIAGIIGTGTNIILKGIDVNLDYMYSKNTLLLNSIFAKDQLPSSVSALISYPYENIFISDADLTIQKIETNDFCEISKNMSNLSLNSINFHINEINSDSNISLICYPYLTIFNPSQNLLDTYFMGEVNTHRLNIEKSLKIDGFSINTNKLITNNFKLLDIPNEDVYPNISLNNLTLNHQYIKSNDYSIISLYNMSNESNIGSTNIDISNVFINTDLISTKTFSLLSFDCLYECPNIFINSLKFNYQQIESNHYSAISFDEGVSQTTSINTNNLSINTEHIKTDYFSGISFLKAKKQDHISNVSLLFGNIDTTDIYNHLIVIDGGNFNNWNVHIDNLATPQNNTRSWFKITNPTSLSNFVLYFYGTTKITEFTYDDQGEIVYNESGDPIYQTLSTEHFYGPLISTEYDSPYIFSPDNVHDFYWFKYYDSDYAFGKDGSPDPADDGTVFIPFNASQTDAVVSKLGEGWTKKKVTYHDVEQDKDVEIEIPWLKTE